MKARKTSHFRSSAIALFGVALTIFAGCEPPSPPASPTPTPRPTATPRPAPTPTPIPTIDRKRMDVSRLFNDMEVVTQIDPVRSPETASWDRTQPGSYRLELTVHADVPSPSRTLAQVARNDPTLIPALPGLADRLGDAQVSPIFDQFYALKLDYLKSRLARIDSLLSLQNFYDCETMLELRNPANGARALFLQGDMDVNTDGSDGDRNFPAAGPTQYYQPQTSYRWKRLTARPNPFLASVTRHLATLKAEFVHPGLTATRKVELRDAIADTEGTLYEIQHYSFLIAGADPFIVLPLSMLRGNSGAFSASIGDYAVVVEDGVTYPAIVGDAGPAYKFGEASERLCKEIDPGSTANSRPVDALRATYIVFPGSKDSTTGPPDLDKWGARCAELLTGLGLHPVSLHSWENLIQPWPTPTPTPTPTPVPTPTPTPISTPTPAAASGSETAPAPAPVAAPTPTPTPENTPTPAPAA